MNGDIINFGLQQAASSIIKVIGVGGGGGNAVNHMLEEGIEGVDFIICNTDSQALLKSQVPVKVQLGVTLTEGRGAGNQPEQGEQAAIENLDDLRLVLEGSTKMVFITAGLGGGTGTGAAPVIARLARELDILTIAVVTIPSPAEGRRRFQQALEGASKLKEYVDSMLVISNEKLHKIYGDLPASIAFKKADDIITTAVKGVAEIITLHGNINIDFADVSTVMGGSGVFLMGTGCADGNDRAMKAVKAALDSPLLDSNDINGTKDILLNIISGDAEITMGEIGEIIEYLQIAAGQDANIIWGNGFDDKLGGKISVTIIATGFNTNPNKLFQEEKPVTEFQLYDIEPAINLGEEEIEEKVFVEEPPKTEKIEVKKTEKKRKKELVAEEPRDSGNLDNWFHRQFTRFFEDSDVPLSDEK
ncbi:MAG: cell division protein FtsZ [Bacteroidetes bacterium GWF2_42_66]|nr:MAG: cell division protein FtsZ [Bacteroidetes bacterium GWA2_42_15]OFY00175.1 MAG: cell division protein FtsZ [Bacteroidetes bacterium GWE2_42_39]OFY40317.1 MAG: cell division protein FtsZ [Bacteroidetes bacterium GWF2_42_66]HBL73698.1 cell division protein FtsZ [Prolixibacteraceae bacterium]HCR90708.1 cell division protein FtsZ [Prolixibacteraceae bacterium]